MRPQSPSVFVCRDSVHGALFDNLSATLVQRGVAVVRGTLSPDDGRPTDHPAASWADADVIVTSIRHVLSRRMLAAAVNLRGVVFPTAGVESVDLAAATELGIAVGNGATRENSRSLAEATVMLILASLYDLNGSQRRLAAGLGGTAAPNATMLNGKTVGLIGYGRVAQGVAKRLAPFDVRLLVTSPNAHARSRDHSVTAVDLDTLLGESDVVCVLAALTPETLGLLGPRAFARMKPGAHLINTARGEIVDEEALCRALAEGRIAGAALDVFAREPLPADSPLRTFDNVILTPHMVGHTRETFAAFLPTAVENVTRLLQGEPPLYLCNPEVLPIWQQRLARLSAASARAP